MITVREREVNNMTLEEILEIMGCDPTEVVECEDGLVMTFGKECEDNE